MEAKSETRCVTCGSVCVPVEKLLLPPDAEPTLIRRLECPSCKPPCLVASGTIEDDGRIRFDYFKPLPQ